MRILGEMLLSNLKFRSFKDIGTHYLGPWAGFFISWLYLIFWAIVVMQDAIAVSVYVEPYFPNLPKWIAATFVILLILLLNVVSVRLFGEFEFYLSLIKLITIVVLILVGIYLLVSNMGYDFQVGSDVVRMNASLGNIFSGKGFFSGGFVGFCFGFQLAFASYTGIESLGITAAEAENPRVTLPKAIKSIPIRIGLLYVGALFVILCAIPWERIDELQGSPFTEIFETISLPYANVVMSIVLISAAISGANSGLYAVSRMLYGLSKDRQAPRYLSKLSKNSVPVRGLVVSIVVIFISVIIVISVTNQPLEAFAIFIQWNGVCCIIVSILIIISYYLYRIKYPELSLKSKFKAPFGKVTAAITLFVYFFIIIAMFFDKDKHPALVLTLVTLLLLFLLYHFKIRKVQKIEQL
jgi:D-serine/D-alanine/glycine transporter